jgi:hypothetical protein
VSRSYKNNHKVSIISTEYWPKEGDLATLMATIIKFQPPYELSLHTSQVHGVVGSRLVRGIEEADPGQDRATEAAGADHCGDGQDAAEALSGRVGAVVRGDGDLRERPLSRVSCISFCCDLFATNSARCSDILWVFWDNCSPCREERVLRGLAVR